jgi:hypothetical protein
MTFLNYRILAMILFWLNKCSVSVTGSVSFTSECNKLRAMQIPSVWSFCMPGEQQEFHSGYSHLIGSCKVQEVGR